MKTCTKLLNFSVIVFALSLFSPLEAKPPKTSFDESLQLRKISEYWKEKDYRTAKVHIREFLSKHPKSIYSDQLHAMLGDLFFQEQNFAEAAVAYEKIQGKEFLQKVQFHFLHSLYETGRWEQFLVLAENFLKNPNSNSGEIHTVHFEQGEIYFQKAHAPENEKLKKELMKAAMVEYGHVMQTPYGEMTFLKQAQICAELDDHPKAASIFKMLAHKDQDRKEELLFQAAASELHFDKDKAILTFAAISELGGKNSPKAAYNYLNLLFQEKRYKDYIHAFDETREKIAQDKLPLMQYFLGRSLFFTENFAQAADPLFQALASKSLDMTQKKSALFTLIACANQAKDLPFFEKALAAIKTEFPRDQEMGNLVLMHSQLCREQKQWAKAREDIQEILEMHPEHSQKEALIYDNALLLLEEEKWQESATAFEAFLKSYPQSANRQLILRHIVNARLEDARRASAESQALKKQELLSALNVCINEKKSFSATEKQKMRYLVGKTQFELGKYEDAIQTLSEYVADYKDATCADAYLLLAYAHQRGERDTMHFALNAEKALAINPRLPLADDLHLTLFNFYLDMASNASLSEKGEMIEKGADHLYLALDKPPRLENKRWLASYYYQQYKNGKQAAIERASYVLENLLGVGEHFQGLAISEQTLEKEAEVLKLAELYRKTHRKIPYVQVLEALNKEYRDHPKFAWKYQRMAQFELGKAYLFQGNREKALNVFDELSATSHTSSYFALAATLEKAKIEFSLLDPDENSESFLKICDSLKEIELQRKLHSEPLHLEASLFYIDCKSQLSSEKRIFLLEKMKERYTNQEDSLVQQYFSASAQFPEKKRLCDQYLSFIDLEIQRLKAEQAKQDVALQEVAVRLDQLLLDANEEELAHRILKSKGGR